MLDTAVPARVKSPSFGGKPSGLVLRCHLCLLLDSLCPQNLVLSPKGSGDLGRKGDSRDALMQLCSLCVSS